MGVWGRLSRDGPAFSIDFWWIDRRAACTARTMPRQWPEQGQGSVQDLGYTIPNLEYAVRDVTEARTGKVPRKPL